MNECGSEKELYKYGMVQCKVIDPAWSDSVISQHWLGEKGGIFWITLRTLTFLSMFVPSRAVKAEIKIK